MVKPRKTIPLAAIFRQGTLGSTFSDAHFSNELALLSSGAFNPHERARVWRWDS